MTYIGNHGIHWLAGATVWWALSAAARALPVPIVLGNRAYLFFYNFVQALLANFDKKGP